MNIDHCLQAFRAHPVLTSIHLDLTTFAGYESGADFI